MAELNEQDPITGRKLPRLVNYNGQDPIKPVTNLPRLRNYNSQPLDLNKRGSTGDVQLVDYERSRFDNPGGTFVEDLPILNSIRAENQGFLSTLASGVGRTLVNIIPTVIGNVASILDFEDYANKDAEVGNAITRAMEDFKSTVNKDYLPIYRENPEESFDIGDSAWWIENGSSLAESVGAFAITGAGIGTAFNLAGKGLSMINGLSRLGQAGQAAAALLSATGLNQAESITTAMQVYDTTYQEAIANGQSDEQAKLSAADAASYSININRANIALNLTSAGAFIRSPKLTRQIREAFTGAGRTEMLHEGLQEYAEETINYISQKEGERYGQSKAAGKDYKFKFENAINDALSLEGIESGVLGFIGGAGQTALTRVYNRMNGQALRKDQLHADQQQSIDRINSLQNAGIIPSLNSVFKSMEENTKLQNDIDLAIKAGDDNAVKQLQYQLLNNQLSDSLQNGTVQQLEDVYNNIYNMSSEEAQNRGLDVDMKSPNFYKNKAQEAIQLIKTVEDGYLEIGDKGYINPDEVLDTYIKGKTLNAALADYRKDYNNIHTQALQDKINLDINADLNSENPPKELTDLPSFQLYKISRNVLETLQNQVKSNNENYAKLTSPEYQEELFNKKQQKLKEDLEKAEIEIKQEEEKSIKKRQKEVKKKVDKSKQAPFEDVPIPTEEDGGVTNIDDLFSLEEAIYDPQDDNNEVTNLDEINLEEATLEQDNQLSIKDRIAELEVNKEAEVREASKSVYETGQYNGKEYNSWIDIADEIGAKYDAQIAALNSQVEVTDDNYITPEEKIVADIVEQEEINQQEKEIKKDGLVRSPQDVIAKNKEILFRNMSRQRDVGNTIISLNVNYVENILGNIDTKTNDYNIYDTFDDEGNLIINENFDSRLQSPNQFSVDDVVNITIPSYQDMLERGTDNYTESDYNNNENNVDSFPIAFTDNNGRIIGYLPTQDNIRRRVSSENIETELIKNKRLRETIFNNRDNRYTVKITRKSPGSLLTNNNVRDLYNALGDGNKLANDVSIAIFKDSKLQTSLNSNFNESLINKADLETGFVYSILPTAEKGNYIATPMQINRIGDENARTVIKLIQLYKANPTFDRDRALIQEREELAREIDLSNIVEFRNAVNSVLYTSEEDDAHMFKLTPTKLILGVTKDEIFNLADVLNNNAVQDRVADILSKRFHSVQLSNFGQRFNYWSTDDSGKLVQERYNNYFDYLNQRAVVGTNVQGFPVEGENNQYYFTGQSVIEFSDPILVDRQRPSTVTTATVNDNQITVNEDQLITYPSDAGNIQYVETAPGEIDLVSNVTEEIAVPKVPKNKLGIKFKPKNRPQIEEDFNFISEINNLNTLDEQAEKLMKKCQG